MWKHPPTAAHVMIDLSPTHGDSFSGTARPSWGY
jgi:hypothetical protein